MIAKKKPTNPLKWTKRRIVDNFLLTRIYPQRINGYMPKQTKKLELNIPQKNRKK
ncbi:hypothetical protein GM3708_1635 [Geminocystis sp. NIES-3708]|nr:hypothetical protein GM3708_1635 [Geminocystis sp. NIES-3708]